MNHDKEKIINWIEENKESMVDFLKHLVRVPSDNPRGDCLPIATYIYESLSALGFEDTSLLEVDSEDVKTAGMISLANVLSSTVFGEGAGPHIGLNAHGDVVPPGLGWTFQPYEGTISNGKMYGRGVAVSKSDIAAYTYAVLALKQIQFNQHLEGTVSLAFTFDEETGGELGPKRLLESGYLQADMAIVAGFTYSAVNAHNGCLHFEVTVTGKSAHAAFPDTGVDAIESTVKILQALYEYRETLSLKKSSVSGIDCPTLVVGLIKGGINTNVVPDCCQIRVDRRLIPEEDAVQAEKEIRHVIGQAVAHIEGLKVEITKILHAQSFGPVSPESKLINTLSANWRDVMKEQGELPVTGVPLYTDARHFYARGIPTVMFGAGPKHLEEANGHRADENIKIEDFVHAVKIVACTLYDLLRNDKVNG